MLTLSYTLPLFNDLTQRRGNLQSAEAHQMHSSSELEHNLNNLKISNQYESTYIPSPHVLFIWAVGPFGCVLSASQLKF